MSEHPGQIYQKPPQSWATFPSGVRYLRGRNLETLFWVLCPLSS